MWAAVLKLLAVCGEFLLAVWKKRERDAADPLQRAEDLEIAISNDDEATVQDRVRRFNDRRRMRQSGGDGV